MTTRIKRILLTLLLSALAAPLWAGTYTAASCNYSDVNAVINGPTHAAVAGDVITIPAGTCTWTSGLSISVGITLTGTGNPNTGPSTFGSGTLNTVIIDNVYGLIVAQGIPYGQTLTIAMLDIEPASSSTALISPIQIAGTCTSSGCPNIRVHNIGFGLTTPWTESGNSSNANWMIRTDNVFGVIEHCTLPTNSSVVLVSSNNSAYLGVGGYGDSSWAQPDTFGGANVLYIENNNLYVTLIANECEVAPSGGGVGGCRNAARFNQLTGNNASVFFGGHGLDTDGRPQGQRQLEVYGNIVNCEANCAGGMASFRSGTGFVFGNTMNTSGLGFYGNIAGLTAYRTVFSASSGWGACGGSSPYDTNDGIVYYSGTATSASGLTLTDTSKSWTTNQFIPNGAPYSVYDVTQHFWSEIASNTGNSVTVQQPISESGWSGFNNGDSYQILRATVCAEQGGRGQGNYVSGIPPSPASPLSQALDPIYEWDNTAAHLLHGDFGTNTGRTIANRDWYTDNSNGSPQAQTSPTSPFNGTSGVGFGTLANRPTTCTPHVGYEATDQGSWNQSANGFGQGQLFVCTSTNTWSIYYTPYTYPHPLTQGTGNQGTGSQGTGSQGTGSQGTGNTPPSPPTSLSATVQ